jgi:hypothetical protein
MAANRRKSRRNISLSHLHVVISPDGLLTVDNAMVQISSFYTTAILWRTD